MEHTPDLHDGRLRLPMTFAEEISKAEVSFRKAALKVIEEQPNHARLLHQADWHIKGILHHARNVLDAYTEFANDVASRASITPPPDVIVMHAPSFQEMMFEFYALVNLARITMDNLRFFLRPVFKTEFVQLPKSVNRFLQGNTNCPAYLDLIDNPALQYLCDLRNCIVHFRTFATSDNAVIVCDQLGKDEQDKLLLQHQCFDPMARAHFRRVDEGVSVNVFLPDCIFDHSSKTEKLVQFTYEERYNLLSQSMSFIRLICCAIGHVYILLLDPGTPTYVFSKK